MDMSIVGLGKQSPSKCKEPPVTLAVEPKKGYFYLEVFKVSEGEKVGL